MRSDTTYTAPQNGAQVAAQVELPREIRARQHEITAGFLNEIDRHLLPEIHALGLKAMALPTIMKNDDDRISLARSVVKAGLQWASGS